MPKKLIPYYIFIIIIYLLLSLWYKNAGNTELFFLLKPTTKIVELTTGSPSSYNPEKGYLLTNFHILINNTCSGFNFLLLCFTMAVFTALKYAGSNRKKIFIIPVLFTISYLFTLFVNSSRIVLSILGQGIASKFLSDQPHLLLHDTIGIVIYLMFLICFYVGLIYICKKTLPVYAKSN